MFFQYFYSMKGKFLLNSLILLIGLQLVSCNSSSNKETESSTVVEPVKEVEKINEISPEKTIIDSSKSKSIVKSETNQLSHSPAKGTKTYYDKPNNVSLVYPDNWLREYNQNVVFKINSPQENEKDTIQENFFYAVIEENPQNSKVIAQQPKPVILTIDQMASQTQSQLTMESPNRKQCKIIASHKFVLNNVPAYEFISVGIIKGVSMKYRIVLMKIGTKQYYLYFSSEANKFDFYQREADMIFGSFLVK